MRRYKRILSAAALIALFSGNIPSVYAQTAPAASVVINEIAWAGTAASSSDEWIELYNATDGAVDLSGWSIDDGNGARIYGITAGTIASKSYFLIEDAQETTSVAGDLIVGLTLNNSGTKLVLKNAAGQAVDTVNGSGGSWYAGSNTTKATMERIDSSSGNDVASNWASNTQGNGATDRNAGAINATPRAQNSVSSANQAVNVSLVASDANPKNGDDISVEARVDNVRDLFSYGMDITYDPAVLDLKDVSRKPFLSSNDTVITSFQAGLENGGVGKLVIAEARVDGNRAGISGNGALFAMNFRVIGAGGTSSSVSVANGGFLADSSQDFITRFSGASVSVKIIVVQPVTGLQASEAAERYKLTLAWVAPAEGAQRYKVSRKNSAGTFVEIGAVQGLTFMDGDNAAGGGKIVPNVNYEYQIIAVRDGVDSVAVSVIQKDTRGVKGDNNRSDRVDGRDLEKLARHFGELVADSGFDPLADTTYDGRIDGGDLIDLAASWALTY